MQIMLRFVLCIVFLAMAEPAAATFVLNQMDADLKQQFAEQPPLSASDVLSALDYWAFIHYSKQFEFDDVEDAVNLRFYSIMRKYGHSLDEQNLILRKVLLIYDIIDQLNKGNDETLIKYQLDQIYPSPEEIELVYAIFPELALCLEDMLVPGHAYSHHLTSEISSSQLYAVNRLGTLFSNPAMSETEMQAYIRCSTLHNLQNINILPKEYVDLRKRLVLAQNNMTNGRLSDLAMSIEAAMAMVAGNIIWETTDPEIFYLDMEWLREISPDLILVEEYFPQLIQIASLNKDTIRSGTSMANYMSLFHADDIGLYNPYLPLSAFGSAYISQNDLEAIKYACWYNSYKDAVAESTDLLLTAALDYYQVSSQRLEDVFHKLQLANESVSANVTENSWLEQYLELSAIFAPSELVLLALDWEEVQYFLNQGWNADKVELSQIDITQLDRLMAPFLISTPLAEPFITYFIEDLELDRNAKIGQNDGWSSQVLRNWFLGDLTTIYYYTVQKIFCYLDLVGASATNKISPELFEKCMEQYPDLPFFMKYYPDILQLSKDVPEFFVESAPYFSEYLSQLLLE